MRGAARGVALGAAVGASLGLGACSPAQLLNATVPTGGLEIARDVPYGPLPRQTLDIYRPVGVLAGRMGGASAPDRGPLAAAAGRPAAAGMDRQTGGDESAGRQGARDHGARGHGAGEQGAGEHGAGYRGAGGQGAWDQGGATSGDAGRGGGGAVPVVVFFYGGSWNSGSKAIYPFVAATLARAGFVVVVPDYRLYPQVKYPDFLRDCARAVAWVQGHRDRTGGGPLFLMGHSAGAYNALMLGLDPAWLDEAGGHYRDLAGVIGMAGPYDFLPITDPEIMPIFPDAGPATQPITYARGDGPPLLLLAGTADRQVRPRNTQRLAAKVAADGGQVQAIYYKGLGHIGLVTAIAPAFQWRAPVLRDVVAFLRHTAVTQAGQGVSFVQGSDVPKASASPVRR